MGREREGEMAMGRSLIEEKIAEDGDEGENQTRQKNLKMKDPQHLTTKWRMTRGTKAT